MPTMTQRIPLFLALAALALGQDRPSRIPLRAGGFLSTDGLSSELAAEIEAGRFTSLALADKVCLAGSTLACAPDLKSAFTETSLPYGERASALGRGAGQDNLLMGNTAGEVFRQRGSAWEPVGHPRNGAVAGVAELADQRILVLYRESGAESESMAYVGKADQWTRLELAGNFVLQFDPAAMAVRTDVGTFVFDGNAWVNGDAEEVTAPVLAIAPRLDGTKAGAPRDVGQPAEFASAVTGAAATACTLTLYTTQVVMSGYNRVHTIAYRSTCAYAVGQLITAKPNRWAWASATSIPAGTGSFQIRADAPEYQGRLGFIRVGAAVISIVQWGTGPGALGSCYPTSSGSSIQLPFGTSMPAAGGTYRLSALAINQCRYRLVTNRSDITPLDPLLTEGIGNNVFPVPVQRNTSGLARTATITTNWGSASSSNGVQPRTLIQQAAR